MSFKLHNRLGGSRDPFTVVNNLSNSAFGVYSKFGWQSSMEGLDGHLSNSIMANVAPSTKELDELVSVGLLVVDGSHYRIPHWEKYQQTASQVAKEAQKTRERVQRHRAKKAAETAPVRKPRAAKVAPAVVVEPAAPVVEEAVEAIEVVEVPVVEVVEEEVHVITEVEIPAPKVTVEVIEDEPVADEKPVQPAVDDEEWTEDKILEFIKERAQEIAEAPEFSSFRKANLEEAEMLREAGGVSQLIYEIENAYPRKRDNGRISRVLENAIEKHGWDNIIAAAEECSRTLNRKAEKTGIPLDESEVLPMREWLQDGHYLDTKVFDKVCDEILENVR